MSVMMLEPAVTEYRDIIPVIVEREGATLPEGFDSWGLKSVKPDLKTRNNYQWPFPGRVATALKTIPDNKTECPCAPGDGLCVGLTWGGMASGGMPARTLLLVAYNSERVLGQALGKVRTTHVAVVALVDGEELLRVEGAGADLRGADLRGADLRGANLHGADLYGANLSRTNLFGADLSGANLSETNLFRADLSRTNLFRADLSGAILSGADLFRADLSGAALFRADLSGADLRGADLRGANLYGAGREDLRRRGAIL